MTHFDVVYIMKIKDLYFLNFKKIKMRTGKKPKSHKNNGPKHKLRTIERKHLIDKINLPQLSSQTENNHLKNIQIKMTQLDIYSNR